MTAILFWDHWKTKLLASLDHVKFSLYVQWYRVAKNLFSNGPDHLENRTKWQPFYQPLKNLPLLENYLNSVRV